MASNQLVIQDSYFCEKRNLCVVHWKRNNSFFINKHLLLLLSFACLIVFLTSCSKPQDSNQTISISKSEISTSTTNENSTNNSSNSSTNNNQSLETDTRKNSDVYDVGSIGPAGGYVFYDKGSYSDGWRYLEAAPCDLRVVDGIPSIDSSNRNYSLSEQRYCFGFYRTTESGVNLFINGTSEYNESNCTRTEIGTGKNNTALLVQAIGSAAYKNKNGSDTTSNYAANLCATLVYKNGNVIFDDWFLPSKGELNAMFINLHKQGLGNFTGDILGYESCYWSSSEGTYGAQYAWRQHFYDGELAYSNQRDNRYRIRPIRAF